MINRLLGIPNAELVAVEARYHRKKCCLPQYVNPLNIKAHLVAKKDNVYTDT